MNPSLIQLTSATLYRSHSSLNSLLVVKISSLPVQFAVGTSQGTRQSWKSQSESHFHICLSSIWEVSVSVLFW